MKGKKGFVILAAVMVLLIVAASLLYNHLSRGYQGNLMAQENNSVSESQNREEVSVEESETEPPKELTMAPAFDVTDREGNMVNLTDFYGKPIIVNFWASWCGPCKSEMPDFEEAYQTYGEEVHFLMVNMTDGARETVEVAQAYIDEQGYTFPLYFDTMQDAAMTYGVTSIPSTFFIDEEGHAVAYAQGAISSDVLKTGLEMIVASEDGQ